MSAYLKLYEARVMGLLLPTDPIRTRISSQSRETIHPTTFNVCDRTDRSEIEGARAQYASECLGTVEGDGREINVVVEDGEGDRAADNLILFVDVGPK